MFPHFLCPCMAKSRPRRISGRGGFFSAVAAALPGTLDAGLTAGHGHTVADRYGHTELLLERQRAAAAAAVGGAGDAGTALTGHRGRSHDGGGVQRQRRGDIHALGGHFIAAGGGTGLLHRTGLERRMLIDFIDAQRCSLISRRLYPALPGYTSSYDGGAVPVTGPL